VTPKRLHLRNISYAAAIDSYFELIETTDAGSILLHGEDTTDQHVRDRQVGFVFQHYALFRHMSVFENVAFGMRVRPRQLRLSETAIRNRVHHLLNMV
jgi:sulfate/thiosulfate transport system ATP-binding protein